MNLQENVVNIPDNNTVRCVLITACDIGAITKKWQVQYQVIV